MPKALNVPHAPEDADLERDMSAMRIDTESARAVRASSVDGPLARRLRRLRLGLQTVVDLFRGVWQGPYRWLVIVLVVLLPAAVFLVVLKAVPAVSPFVYTLF